MVVGCYSKMTLILFGVVLRMENLNALINRLEYNAQEDWAIQEDMSSMYIDDANDAQIVLDLLEEGDVKSAKELINLMDTSIREGVIIAIAKDNGSIWTAINLGWEV